MLETGDKTNDESGENRKLGHLHLADQAEL